MQTKCPNYHQHLSFLATFLKSLFKKRNFSTEERILYKFKQSKYVYLSQDVILIIKLIERTIKENTTNGNLFINI